MMTAMSGKFLPSPNPAELAKNGPNRQTLPIRQFGSTLLSPAALDARYPG